MINITFILPLITFFETYQYQYNIKMYNNNIMINITLQILHNIVSVYIPPTSIPLHINNINNCNTNININIL